MYYIVQLHKKLGLKDKQLYLGKHLRTNNDYKDLEMFIQRLNNGYLLYKADGNTQMIEMRRNAQLGIGTLGQGKNNVPI